MKLTRYICTHCGRGFEAEEREILECPGCFWSTSVKKEEDDRPEAAPSADSSAKKPSRKPLFPKDLLRFIVSAFALAALAGGILFFWPAVKKFAGQQKDWAGGLLGKLPRPGGISLKGGRPEPETPSSPVPSDPLTLEERNHLNRRLELDPNRTLSEEEQKILGKRSSFRTGLNEKLPSQTWTLQSFKEMIAGQEGFYKVPLPRSYKNKLYGLFQKKYVPGAEAFKNGDLLQARNLWVEALAFPVYANNIEKHRGVVLTMLRPFITDTLSKIGAINGILTEQKIREKEKSISRNYERLLGLIERKSWEEALSAVSSIHEGLDELARPDRIAGPSPPYPPLVNQTDEGIAGTLFQLLQVPPPALADIEPLRADILQKRTVIESLIPERLQTVQRVYNEALDRIQRGEWAEAEENLRAADLPPALAGDARRKIGILKKLQKAPEH